MRGTESQDHASFEKGVRRKLARKGKILIRSRARHGRYSIAEDSGQILVADLTIRQADEWTLDDQQVATDWRVLAGHALDRLVGDGHLMSRRSA